MKELAVLIALLSLSRLVNNLGAIAESVLRSSGSDQNLFQNTLRGGIVSEG
jgi:hypothetical protein